MGTSIGRRASENGEDGAPDRGQGRLGRAVADSFPRSLQAAVLLRATWLDALDLDAEPEPPDRQPAQAEEGIGACERDAVIGANGLGRPNSLNTASNTGNA